MGRSTRGVRAMRLGVNDRIQALDVVQAERREVLVRTRKGDGKRPAIGASRQEGSERSFRDRRDEMRNERRRRMSRMGRLTLLMRVVGNAHWLSVRARAAQAGNGTRPRENVRAFHAPSGTSTSAALLGSRSGFWPNG